jgi:hypothetical protein
MRILLGLILGIAATITGLQTWRRALWWLFSLGD